MLPSRYRYLNIVNVLVEFFKDVECYLPVYLAQHFDFSVFLKKGSLKVI